MLYKLTGSKSSRANEPISSIDRFNSSCRAGGIILQKKQIIYLNRKISDYSLNS